MNCNHDEGILPNGKPCPGRHDCDYVDRRVALIRHAEEVANAAAGPEPEPTKDRRTYARWCGVWNRAFHSEMNRLSAEGEAKHDEVKSHAQNEMLGGLRRWLRKGLTLGEASVVLRTVKEALQ